MLQYVSLNEPPKTAQQTANYQLNKVRGTKLSSSDHQMVIT